MITLPLIKNVANYKQENGLTTIFFEADLVNGRGLIPSSFQINNYELHWYYKQLGWDQRYSPFQHFWSEATEKERLDYLFIFITDEKAWICSGAKEKVRNAVPQSKSVIIHQLKWAS